MNSDEEFLKAMMSIEPLVEEPREYRFHYNENGDIYMCTMQNHPEDTEYLVVDEDVYNRYYDYYISDGQLKMIDRTSGIRVQLKSSTQGYAVVKNHAGILLENEDCNDVEYYEDN